VRHKIETKAREKITKACEAINLIFTEPASTAYPLKELSSCSILHHNCQMCGSQNHLQNQHPIEEKKKQPIIN